MLPVWLKALLFVGGGLSAAAGAAYVTGALDPWFGKQPAVVAAVPPANQTQTAPATQPNAVTQEPKAEEPAKTTEVPLPNNDPVTTQKDDRLAAPSFDLLRVEGDGSVVIAGKAPAKARVEIMHGDKVLAEAAANADGDFVAVFDEALAPGDYVLSLKATTPDNQSTVSTETAIVAVPETKDGQVLAMVEQPGAPATLLTVPQAPATSGDAQATTAPAAVEEKPADVAAAASSEEPKPEESASAPATAIDEAPAAAADAPAQTSDQQVAAAPSASAPATTEQPAADQSRVVVEAVEIEGDTIFVAGFANPGLTVRVYADETVIGEAVASEGGRFLVEAKRNLPVGSYVIRADLLTRDGAVVARAAVPFEREAGESIAAVAAPQSQTEAPNAAETEPAKQGEATAAAQTEEKPATETAAQESPATTQPAGTSEPTAAAAAEPAKDDAMTAAPLQRVDGSVIIRRGDSLWRISRRVYGQGIRYSTIYLANQDQIQNPDRIWPGQVFSVPRETAEGETADMDAIAEQAVAPEEKVAQ